MAVSHRLVSEKFSKIRLSKIGNKSMNDGSNYRNANDMCVSAQSIGFGEIWLEPQLLLRRWFGLVSFASVCRRHRIRARFALNEFVGKMFQLIIIIFIILIAATCSRCSMAAIYFTC